MRRVNRNIVDFTRNQRVFFLRILQPTTLLACGIGLPCCSGLGVFIMRARCTRHYKRSDRMSASAVLDNNASNMGAEERIAVSMCLGATCPAMYLSMYMFK